MLTSMRWKRNRRLVLLTIAGFTVLTLGFGSARVTAITSSERGTSEEFVSVDIQGLVDLFDDSVVHELEVTFDQADYERMIESYQTDDTKEYIEASVTIDGTTISSVGLRLKGNSTLMGLRGTSQDPADGQGDVPLPDGAQPPADGNEGGEIVPEANGAFGRGQGGGIGGDISADDPYTLPWLLSFDEYVEGQRYQGYEEIAIRPVGTGETMLNEVLSLNLIALAGEPSQEAMYSSFVINGGDAQLRLVVEVPGEMYTLENFETDGVLYKALSTGSFEYLGDDPLAYEDAFEQITRTNQQDLKPLINLLRWVSEASDEEFAADLDQYVDVESLARYIALQELLQNFDDMSGPGQNYYLWYDLETEQFTVLTWDLNLAFGQGGVGGRFGAGNQGVFPEAEGTPPGGEQFDPSQVPGGQLPGAGGDGTEQPDPPQFPDGQRPAGDGGENVFGGGMGGNLLKERFLAAPEFEATYADAYAEMYAALYGDGQADAELERLSQVVAESGLVDPATIETGVAALRTALETQVAAGAEVAP